MSDYVSFGPSDGRTQAVLREAFASRHRRHEPPIAADAPPSTEHRSSHLRVAGVAVAAALVAGWIALGVGSGAERGERPTHQASTPTTAADGWRWDSYHGVRVLVPSSWAYALEPAGDWCRDSRASVRRQPYVSLGASAISVGDTGCRDVSGRVTGLRATDLWAPHVALNRATDAARTSTTRNNGWWVVRRLVGDVLVKAVSHDRTIADRIAASAQIVGD